MENEWSRIKKEIRKEMLIRAWSNPFCEIFYTKNNKIIKKFGECYLPPKETDYEK